MKLVDVILQVSILMLLTPFTSAFYYYSNGGERKCFYKELVEGTLLQGKYNVEVYDESLKLYKAPTKNEISVVVDVEEVFDDNHRVMNPKGGARGEFTFNALDSGEHKICIQPQAQGWMAKVKTKVVIEFETGSTSNFDVKTTDGYKPLQTKIEILNERVLELKKEQELVREREAMFRNASESANSRAMWWTVFQVFILGGTCAWQLRHLRTFFVKQKIL